MEIIPEVYKNNGLTHQQFAKITLSSLWLNFNPFEKNARQIGSLPQVIICKNKKWLKPPPRQNVLILQPPSPYIHHDPWHLFGNLRKQLSSAICHHGTPKALCSNDALATHARMIVNHLDPDRTPSHWSEETAGLPTLDSVVGKETPLNPIESCSSWIYISGIPIVDFRKKP